MKVHGAIFVAAITVMTGCDQNPLPPVSAAQSTSSITRQSSSTVVPNSITVSIAPPVEQALPMPTSTPVSGVTGKVFDLDNGRPLADAVVIVAHEMYATDMPPVTTTDGFVTKTDTDGSFRLLGVAPGSYPVEVFAPGHIAIHEQLTITDATTVLPTFHTSRLTPEEQNWLNQLNRDRSGWGAPPLVADEAVVEAARLRAGTMAENGIFSHDCLPHQKNCMRGPEAELARGAFQAGGENIGAQNEGSWRDVESGMISEWTRCTPAARKPHADGCNFSEETGHFLNMVNRSYHFVGVAAHHHGRSFDVSYGPSTDYYTMEFE